MVNFVWETQKAIYCKTCERNGYILLQKERNQLELKENAKVISFIKKDGKWLKLMNFVKQIQKAICFVTQRTIISSIY